MNLTYAPDGADPRTWVVKPRKIPVNEAIDVERVTGLTWAQFRRDLDAGSMAAVQALLWMLLKRENPSLRLDQVVFCEDDFTIAMDDEQVAAYLAHLKGLDPAEDEADRAARAAVVEELEQRLAESGSGGDGEGKATRSNAA